MRDAFAIVTPALYEGAPTALAAARQLEAKVTAAFKGTAYEPAWLDIATFGETATLSDPITSEPPRYCNCSVLTTLGPCPLGKNCVPIECGSAAISGAGTHAWRWTLRLTRISEQDAAANYERPWCVDRGASRLSG